MRFLDALSMDFALGNVPLAAVARSGEAVYEWTRLESLRDSGGLVFALVAGLLALLVYVWLVYRREARTVSMVKAMLLATLRTVAIVGLVAFFLGLEKRSSSEVIESSRVAVLVDTSLSMGLPNGATTTGVSRSEQLVELLANSPLLKELTEGHDVDLVSFDESTRPFLYLPQKQPDVEGESQGEEKGTGAGKAAEGAETVDPLSPEKLKTQLTTALDPAGHETRLGDAITATLQRYRGLPLASIVVLTDGGQNAGVDLPPAGEAAAVAKVKIHALAFGPDVVPANVAVRELIAPEQAYPGDKLLLQAVVHAQGSAARQLDLQLFRRLANETDTAATDAAAWELVESQQVTTKPGDDLQTHRFETNPAKAGKYVYEIRVAPAANESQSDDNQAQAEVAIVDRKTRVLLYAGGPARDYRYLRNQLRRDKSFVVDVLLETGVEGISQDADEILNEFPTSAEQLSTYDAIVAFDPNWSMLSAEQVGWLEQWVARQAGGLIVMPGKVNMSRWGIDSRMRPIRNLFPIKLPNRLLGLRDDSISRDRALPLVLTRAGNEAEFLWLADSRQESEAIWREFDGVFGAIEHQGPKPGATVYAGLGMAGDGPGPAYLVSQYYGAGQVFYLGSSELWRLRSLDTNYCERLWTGLLRHVSQGRLLQGSPRGKLLASQDRYEVGDTVSLRAVMSDQQLEPLTLESLPMVVEMPGGQSESLRMPAEEEKPGNYAAEFRVVEPGAYRFVLPVPDSTDELVRTVRVAVPQLEIRQTVRNAEGLRQLAKQTGGQYYDSTSIAIAGSETVPSIVVATPSQARTKRVLGAIDQPFAERLALILLAIVAGALCLEWVVRRLSYLA